MTPETLTTADASLGFISQEEEVSVESLPVRGELPAWLGGTLVRVTPALLEPGAPLVRRAGDAQRLRHRRRAGVLRQPLPREPRVPPRARARRSSAASASAPTPAARSSSACRSLFDPGHDRQLQRERDPPRRALDRDDRDADRDRVRPGDARDDRAARVDSQQEPRERPPGLRLRAPRADQLRGALRAAQQLPALRRARRLHRAAHDRQGARARAGLHALALP